MARRVGVVAVHLSVALALASSGAEAAWCLDGRRGPISKGALSNTADDVGRYDRSGVPAPAPAISDQPDDTLAPPRQAESSGLSSPRAPRSSAQPTSDAFAAAQAAPIAYAIVERNEEPVLGGVRVLMKIRLSRKATQPELWSIGEEIILQERTWRRLNAIALFYYLPDAVAADAWAAAKAVWAPEGDWDAAHTVRLGDYSRHRHIVAGGDGPLGRKGLPSAPEHDAVR